MNCQTFEPTVNDLARGRMMEASLRESALTHAEECGRCGQRLAGERTLTSGLRAYVASVETMEAPASVEASLRVAFRQRQTIAKVTPAVANAPIRARRWMQWATAAAAAIVTVLAIQAFRFRESPAPLARVNNAVGLPTEKLAIVPPSPSPSPDDVVVTAGGTAPRGTRDTTGREVNNLRNLLVSNRTPRSPREAPVNQADSEIVTDFMPLTYGAAMSPNEGGQLVRVELPRSALVSMGLPMNAELSNERVKADVLLGHDGLARAIRFVR